MLAIGLLSLSSWRSLRTIQGLEQNEIAIERTCGEVMRLDEVLTMSARMGAATGDPEWEQRYQRNVPRLDRAITAARRLAPITEETAGSRQTENANARLVAIESEAFALTQRGQLKEATALLAGEEYDHFEHVYSNGNDRYLVSMRSRVTKILHAERIRAIRDSALLAVLLPLIALMGVRVARSISTHARQRTAIETRLREDATALERKNEEAHEAARVKSEFLARMSHEIRTPMNGVLGIAEILSRTPLNDEQIHYVDTIVGSGNLLESILNDILDFSKIEAGMLTGHVKLRVENGATPDTLKFTVSDTGVGIAQDRLAEVFESFVQADGTVAQKFGGTGLGLTISRELSRAMGGKLRVESELGVGTTFSAELPAPSSVESAQDSTATAFLNVKFDARVLVAEDNPVNRLVAQRMLEGLGCHVELVSDGQACIDRFRVGSYDLILMDLKMPVVDGLGATRAIRELEPRGSRTPVIAFTASAFPGDIDACRDADMDGFLSKPVRERALVAVLSRWLAPAPADPRLAVSSPNALDAA